MPTHIKNRGTGAGGAQTNKNGLDFEKLIGLEDEIQILKRNKDHDVIIFKQDSLREFLYTEKAKFHKCMTDYRKSEVKKGHGCKFPDGAVVDLDHRKIFILEKKFQQCSGSVCEKVQTVPFKIWNYQNMYPDFDIIYIFWFSDWFKENIPAELEFLDLHDVPYFWSEKQKLVDFILGYEL